MRSGSILTAVIASVASLTTANSASPASPPAPDDCLSLPRMHALDFWLGSWTVSWRGQVVGTNRIETMLKGCAIMEHWRDVEGAEGKSVFYYDPTTDRWKQVWLTDHAFRRGGTKEKTELREHTSSGRVLFQGRYPDPESGATITDRTTLTRQADGTLRHLIEVSTDDGKTWRTSFDGLYRRQSH
jgi:hypothetical protein